MLMQHISAVALMNKKATTRSQGTYQIVTLALEIIYAV